MSYAKLTVSREVAEALAECERNYISTDMTLVFHAQNGLTGKYAPLQTLTISELATALIVGYEVEKSPEEKVREYYDMLGGGTWERDVVVNALDLLGIKIEGVNAE